eukprot:6580481-Prymnesium_polylepis.1
MQGGLVLKRDRPGERRAVRSGRCGLLCSHGQRGADGVRGGHGRTDGQAGRVLGVRSGHVPKRDGRHR